MPRWGSFNFQQFEKLAKNFDKAVKERLSEKILISILHEAGNRVLRKTKKRTPVGVYDDGRVGGTLRRGWYVSNVKRKGKMLYIEIYNIVEYAPYVELGHRKVNNKGWVEGKYMLTISMKEVEALLPKIADLHTQRVLKELFEI